MKKYVKNYLKHHRLDETDYLECEIPECCDLAVDIHHVVYKSQGGTDEASNLIALCRKHHEDAHKKILTVEQLFGIVQSN